MKILIFNLLLILVLLYQSPHSKAQSWYGNIDSLILVPNIPTVNDTVKIIVYSTFPNSPCFLLSDSISIMDSIVTVNAIHFPGSFSAICNTIDTVNLGVFLPGNYTILYNLTDSYPAIYDIDTLYFTIPQPNSINEVFYSETIFKNFPNPFSNSTVIPFDVNLKDFETWLSVYNYLGQEVRKVRITDSTLRFERNELSNGIYYFIIFSTDQMIGKGEMLILQ